MPKITAPTVAEHREQRRSALLSAAASLMAKGSTFTVAEVATEVGLSRSAVYEYYRSAADLIADVVVDELAEWADILHSAVADADADADHAVDAWVRAVFQYVVDGRHALIRSASTVDLPATRRAQVQSMHRELILPLQSALETANVPEAARTARYVWGVVEAAITRIETQRVEPTAEIDAVLAFIRDGIRQH